MENTARVLTVPNIHRVLEYRKGLRSLFLVLMLAAPILTATGVTGIALYPDQLSVVVASIFAISLGLTSVTLAWLWLRPMEYPKVIVSATGLNLKREGHAVELAFPRVAAIKFDFLPYAGGWFTLSMHDGEHFKFSAGLERSDYLLDALAIAQPTLISVGDLERYRRATIVMDHSLARAGEKLANLPRLVMMQMALPLVLTIAVLAAFSVSNLSHAVYLYCAIGILNGLVALAIGFPSEIMAMRKKHLELVNNPLNPLRDLGRERKIRQWLFALHVVLISTLTFLLCWVL